MKRWMLTLLLLAGFTVHAAPPGEYDGRYLRREITFTLNEDGSWIRDYHHVFKYNSHFATRRIGETFILFNPEFQQLDSIQSVTTMKDGKRVSLPGNALNPVLPRVAHNQPGFSHLREMVVTHTGLERGAQVELSYRITTKPGFAPGFFARENLAERLPIDHLRIRVVAQGKRQLHFSSTNELMPTISRDKGTQSWTWTLKDIPPLTREIGMTRNVSPVIFLGENSNWKSVFSAIPEVGDLPEDAVKCLKKSISHTISDAERLVKISRWMNDTTDLCAVGPELSGWKSRSLAEIYQIHSATAMERALLGVAALKHAGLNPHLLALCRGWMDAEGPVLPQWDGFLIEIDAPGKKKLYLDPTGHMKGLFPVERAGEPVYDVAADSFRTLDTLNAEDHGVEITGKIRLRKQESTGFIELKVSGGFMDYPSALEDPDEFITRFAHGVIPFCQFEVEQIKEVTVHSMSAHLKVKSLSGEEFSHEILSFRQPEVPMLTRRLIGPEKRETALKLAHPLHFKVSLDLECIDPVIMEYAGPEIDLHGRNAHFIQRFSEKKKGEFHVEWSLDVPMDTVSPESYTHFRQVLSHPLSPADWWILRINPKP